MPVVRRLTGGGVVFHDKDLVFSLGINSAEFPAAKSVEKSYFWIHKIIQLAFKERSIRAVQAKTEGVKVSPEISRSACFKNPVPGDLLFKNKKIVGGAQKRRKNVLLHQGSIMLQLEQEYSFEPDFFTETLRESFENELGINFKEAELGADVVRRAQELSNEFYGSKGSVAA